MEFQTHFLIFGGSLWAFTLFGVALHVADVQRRARLETMALEDYHKARPIEWLLASLLMFAAGAATMGAVVIWGMGRSGSAGAIVRFQVLVGAALAAVALAYIAMRGKTWVHWAKDEFLGAAGATVTQGGEVSVNVALEAKYDTAIIKRMVWPVYAIASAPLVLAALCHAAARPLVLLGALLAVLAGTALVCLLLTSFPVSEEDEDW